MSEYANEQSEFSQIHARDPLVLPAAIPMIAADIQREDR
jgi:hypothetical protein